MGTFTEANPNTRELLTEILDKTRWWSTLSLITGFLHSKRVERVRVEFGFVLDRDLMELGHKIRSSGIKVYDSGRLI
jgi:hypothetical protein